MVAVGHVFAVSAESASPWVIDDPTDVSAESRVRVRTTAFAASDFAPVIHFVGEAENSDNPPKPGINRAMGIAQAGVFSDHLGFQIGVFRRADAFGIANSDALAVIQAANSKTSLDVGRTYSGSYSYRVTDMEGIRIGKVFDVPMPEKSGWSGALGVSFSPLRAISILQDDVSARLYNYAINAYVLDGQRSQANSMVNASDYNAYLQNGNPSANGYTSDFGLSLQNTGGFRLYLISDLASRLNWHDVPSRSYSVQGFTGTRGTPLPAGFATTAPFSTELTGKMTVGISFPFQSLVIDGAVTHVNGLNDPALSFKQGLGGGWSTQIGVYPHWHALGLGVFHPKFGSLRVTSDTTSVNQARALGLTYEIGFAF
jgi:hypothetical protein